MISRPPVGRPTWRTVALAAAGAALGALGAATGRELLVWFAVIVSCLIVVVGIWAVFHSLRGRNRTLVRTMYPNQLQVGQRANTSVAFPVTARPPPLSMITDTLPPELTGTGPRSQGGLLPTVRGRHVLGPTHLHRRDPFGLFRWRTVAREPDAVVVWPRTDAVDPEIFQRLRTMTIGTAGFPTPQPDDLSLREYRYGDPLSRVYWKRSAAIGTLLVRHDEPGRTAHFDLVLIPGARPNTELAVDVLAAAAHGLASPEFTLRLLTPDEQTTGDLDDLLTALALTNSYAVEVPASAPQGVVVVAMAADTLAAAQELTSWVASSLVDPDAVFIFPTADLSAAVHRQLDMFTVLSP